MKEYQSLSHTTWDCKYHVVFIPKCRKQRIWARGYFVSTVGLDEAMVRAYIRNQESEDNRYGQMKFGL